jgi:two-component system sensor kinase FixL
MADSPQPAIQLGGCTARPGLVEAPQFLAAIAASSNDAIIGKDLSGIVTFWNNAAERLFGYSVEEMIGQPISRIIPATHSGEEQSILARVGQGERLTHFQTERCASDGRIIPVSLSLSPILDDAGQVIGISDIMRDLSETQYFSAILQQRDGLFRSILDSNPDGMIVIDERGLVQFFSRSAERMFGYPADEVVGRNISMLMPEPYQSAHDGYMARYQTTGERRIIGIGRVVAGRRRDGSTFPMDLQIGEAELGATRRFTGFVRDLTEREDRDRRLAELQSELMHVARLSELGQMVSALAHEVNQPLTAVANYLRGMKRLLDDRSPPLLVLAIDKVAEQAERAQGIIHSLRALVKKDERPREEVALEALIIETSALVLAGHNRRVTLTLDIAPDAAVAFIDRVQIQQVLLNLMRNAVEAMSDSPERVLTIRTRAEGERAVVTVHDTGPGLSEAVRARLFQPFVTSKTEGLGVGLSISRTIIENHGGQLKLSNDAGAGAAFTFSLPIAALPGAAR